MARHNTPYPPDDPYGQQSPYDQSGAYGGNRQGPSSPYDSRGQQDAYGRQGVYDPYGQASQGRDGSGRQRSPYSQEFDNGPSRATRSSRGQAARQDTAQPTAYPVGAGRTYTSSRSEAANRAAGVRPVTARDYLDSPYSSDLRDRHGSRGPLLSRRALIGVAGGTAAAALLLGFTGVAWYTHRAVACTVDGQPREAPVGSTAADLVERGYARPRAGNLVSIAAEGEAPAVLQEGGGEPYTLTVNGEPANPETWKLKEGDDVAFANGADVTEQVTLQTTEIPCGIQIPDDQYLLTPIGFVQHWGRNGVSTIETGTVSGRVIDRGVTQEPQDLIIACNTHINPEGGLKLALTFDDGPSLEYTPQYLDILARYGAKATFFNLGTQLEGGPEYVAMAKRCADEGHQVASHTYSHSDVTLTGMGVETRNDEIGRTFQLVSNATGVLTEVMRPPYGELRGKGFLQYLASGGNIAYSAYWSVDSLDWELPGADAIVANCTRGLSGDSYNGAVILMHDGGGDRSQDVQALPRIIETFQNAGYEFVTMNDLLKADPTYPEWVWSGYVQRPEGAIVPDTSAYV